MTLEVENIRKEFEHNLERLSKNVKIRAMAREKLFDIYKTIHYEDSGVLRIEKNDIESRNSILGFEVLEVKQPQFNNYIKSMIKTKPIWKSIKHVKNPTKSIYELLRNIGVNPKKNTRGPNNESIDKKDFLYSRIYVYNELSYVKNMYRLNINIPKRKSKPTKYNSKRLLPRIDEVLGDYLKKNESIKELKDKFTIISSIDINRIYSNSRIDLSNIDDSSLRQYIYIQLKDLEENERIKLLNRFDNLINTSQLNLNTAKRFIIIYKIINELTKNNRCIITKSLNPLENSPIFGWNKLEIKNPIEFQTIMNIVVLEDVDGIWLKINGKKTTKKPSLMVYELLRKHNIYPTIDNPNNSYIKPKDYLMFPGWFYKI